MTFQHHFSSSHKDWNIGLKNVTISGFLSPNQRPAKIMFSFDVLKCKGNSFIITKTSQTETLLDLKTGAPSEFIMKEILSGELNKPQNIYHKIFNKINIFCFAKLENL